MGSVVGDVAEAPVGVEGGARQSAAGRRQGGPGLTVPLAESHQASAG